MSLGPSYALALALVGCNKEYDKKYRQDQTNAAPLTKMRFRIAVFTSVRY